MKPERIYLSELKVQIETIDARIAELEDAAYAGALGPRFRPKDREEAKKLLARKKELQQKIIYYDP
jgi:hypothetical protein